MNITDSILLLHTAILDNVLYPIASTSNLNHKPASFLLLLHNIMIALPFLTILLEPGNYLQNDPWNKKKDFQRSPFATACLKTVRMKVWQVHLSEPNITRDNILNH